MTKRRSHGMAAILLCVALVVMLIPETCFAETKEERILKQAPEVYSEENMQEVNILKQKVDEYINSIQPMEIAGKKILDVPLYKQMNNYYCGPASVRMTLKYLGKDVNQSTLASQMGTTSADGTYVYQIKNALNDRLGGTKYKYVLNSEISFGEGLVYSIDKGRPVICHVMTGTLPNYSSTGHNTGHYIVARGYTYKAVGTTGSDTVYYNDPNNDSKYYGRFTSSWSKMRTAITNNAGYYIMSN